MEVSLVPLITLSLSLMTVVPAILFILRLMLRKHPFNHSPTGLIIGKGNMLQIVKP